MSDLANQEALAGAAAKKKNKKKKKKGAKTEGGEPGATEPAEKIPKVRMRYMPTGSQDGA